MVGSDADHIAEALGVRWKLDTHVLNFELPLILRTKIGASLGVGAAEELDGS